jgi:hypothetical protein
MTPYKTRNTTILLMVSILFVSMSFLIARRRG